MAGEVGVVVEARRVGRARDGGVGRAGICEVQNAPVKSFQRRLGHFLRARRCLPKGIAFFPRLPATGQMPVKQLAGDARWDAGKTSLPRDGGFQGQLRGVAQADVLALGHRPGLVVENRERSVGSALDAIRLGGQDKVTQLLPALDLCKDLWTESAPLALLARDPGGNP